MTVHNWILEVIASKDISQAATFAAVQLAPSILGSPPSRPLEVSEGAIYSLMSDMGVRPIRRSASRHAASRVAAG